MREDLHLETRGSQARTQCSSPAKQWVEGRATNATFHFIDTCTFAMACNGENVFLLGFKEGQVHIMVNPEAAHPNSTVYTILELPVCTDGARDIQTILPHPERELWRIYRAYMVADCKFLFKDGPHNRSSRFTVVSRHHEITKVVVWRLAMMVVCMSRLVTAGNLGHEKTLTVASRSFVGTTDLGGVPASYSFLGIGGVTDHLRLDSHQLDIPRSRFVLRFSPEHSAIHLE